MITYNRFLDNDCIAMLAACQKSPDFEYLNEEFDMKTMTATCTCKRKNEPEFIAVFTQADAMAAGLWDKQGPWKQYPKRMLQMRARRSAFTNYFIDLLQPKIFLKEKSDD